MKTESLSIMEHKQRSGRSIDNALKLLMLWTCMEEDMRRKDLVNDVALIQTWL